MDLPKKLNGADIDLLLDGTAWPEKIVVTKCVIWLRRDRHVAWLRIVCWELEAVPAIVSRTVGHMLSLDAGESYPQGRRFGDDEVEVETSNINYGSEIVVRGDSRVTLNATLDVYRLKLSVPIKCVEIETVATDERWDRPSWESHDEELFGLFGVPNIARTQRTALEDQRVLHTFKWLPREPAQ